MTSKTDNHNLAAKLALRREMLKDFRPAEGVSVCDCFSGGEVLWGRLRREFDIKEYLALDIIRKRGRLALDSLRYLENQRWTHNVIDLDAYGAPWKHFDHVLRRGLSCLVFLTVGNTMYSIQPTSALNQIGITFRIPNGLMSGLAGIVADSYLGKAAIGYNVIKAIEALNPGGATRYIGLQLSKKELPSAHR